MLTRPLRRGGLQRAERDELGAGQVSQGAVELFRVAHVDAAHLRRVLAQGVDGDVFVGEVCHLSFPGEWTG